MHHEDFLFFTEAEFAAFVGKSVTWARRQRRLGRSPVYVRVGRTPKYRREDIAAWMQANRIAPGGKVAA